MHYCVTGGAGFIGSHLVDRLLAAGHQVTAYDDFSTGQPEFLAGAAEHPGFRLVRGDVRDRDRLAPALAGVDAVCHLAAHADVRSGPGDPGRDLDQNAGGTLAVCEAMRAAGVRRLAFASSGAVYGEPAVFPTPEDAPFPVQTSFYGASKLAGEGLIGAYVAAFGFQATIFRFVSILGERYSHGHVFDFYRALRADPTQIRVLGDGRQTKSYLYVGDCVDAILRALAQPEAPLRIFNLGTDSVCTVDESLTWIGEALGVAPRRVYAGGPRGWVGDSPRIELDCARMRALGWAPRAGIREAVLRTLAYLQANPWLLERRA